MSQEIALQSRPGKLAYRPECTELSVDVAHEEKRTLVSTDHGEPGALPDSVHHVDFAQMLAHYPFPVTINGIPLSRIPYPNEAGIYRVRIR